jgi:cytochrome c-type biogenesis protein CcmH
MKASNFQRFASVLLLCGALAGQALAVLPSEELRDPKLEARARKIGGELRCLVCQNESIDDSDASLAGDLRVILRERLVSGDTDDQAKAYLVQRYGHFVLLTPPVEKQTLLLWFGPALLLLGGGVWIARLTMKREPARETSQPLTAEEQDSLARRLESENAL